MNSSTVDKLVNVMFVFTINITTELVYGMLVYQEFVVNICKLLSSLCGRGIPTFYASWIPTLKVMGALLNPWCARGSWTQAEN